MSSILKIENLKYKHILNGISLSIEENTFNILIGPNNSGKTTLTKAILGLIKYEGNIIFFDSLSNKKNIKKIRKNIGLFSDLNKLLSGTVMYNIMFPLLNLGYNEDEAKEKLYTITKKLEINKILLNNIEELTSSERALTSFAVAIAGSPKLVIIDNSLDELDKYNRNKIIDYLKKMKESTILFITNSADDILCSDNIILMKNGEIINYGKTKKILENEKQFSKNNIPMPFLADLSHKLKAYNIIDEIYLDIDEMVDEIWK